MFGEAFSMLAWNSVLASENAALRRTSLQAMPSLTWLALRKAFAIASRAPSSISRYTVDEVEECCA